MLKYNYVYLTIGIIILMVVPITLYLLFPHYNIFSFVFVFLGSVFYIRKNFNKIKIERDKLVINNIFYRRNIYYVDIKSILIVKGNFGPIETTKLRIIRNNSNDILVHLEMLPYKENH